MSETKELITQLNLRVDKLISRIAESNQLIEKKEQDILSLTAQLKDKDERIAQLQVELAEAKTVASSSVTSENEELKGRINEMVREIDECISLLKVED